MYALPALRRLPSSSHGVRGLRQVEDGGLGLDQHLQGLLDALAADATVAEALEGEVIRATSGRAVHLCPSA